jgi:hypothetical protein
MPNGLTTASFFASRRSSPESGRTWRAASAEVSSRGRPRWPGSRLDNQKNAQAYETATYPQLLAKLTPFIEGTPRVETYETATSYARA